MEIKHYNISDTDVYICRLIPATKRRESERLTEEKLLNTVLPAGSELTHTDEGKPLIADRNISVSHSRHHLCVALSKTSVVGIDIEEPQERLKSVRHKFLTEQELAGIDCDDTQQLALCWSAKEAIYKMVGARAGLMGENIRIFTDEIEGNKTFRAAIGDEIFYLEIIECNSEYEVVLCRY